jgi:hypothetical protein
MIRFSDKVSVSEVDDELVLLDSRSGTYFGVSAVGRRFFDLLAANQSSADAVAALLLEFDVSEEVLWVDIRRFLAEMKARGLVETDEV